MLPRAMQDAVWANYKRGQEIRKDPTEEYLRVAREARLYVADHEGIELTPIHSDARIDELVEQRIHELVEWYRTFGPIELDEFDRHRGNE